jgi:hypothetical protein
LSSEAEADPEERVEVRLVDLCVLSSDVRDAVRLPPLSSPGSACLVWPPLSSALLEGLGVVLGFAEGLLSSPGSGLWLSASASRVAWAGMRTEAPWANEELPARPIAAGTPAIITAVTKMRTRFMVFSWCLLEAWRPDW